MEEWMGTELYNMPSLSLGNSCSLEEGEGTGNSIGLGVGHTKHHRMNYIYNIPYFQITIS